MRKVCNNTLNRSQSRGPSHTHPRRLDHPHLKMVPPLLLLLLHHRRGIPLRRGPPSVRPALRQAPRPGPPGTAIAAAQVRGSIVRQQHSLPISLEGGDLHKTVLRPSVRRELLPGSLDNPHPRRAFFPGVILHILDQVDPSLNLGFRAGRPRSGTPPQARHHPTPPTRVAQPDALLLRIIGAVDRRGPPPAASSDAPQPPRSSSASTAASRGSSAWK